jgi:peptidoglycan/LPS O-acetylase OafA/YrhL
VRTERIIGIDYLKAFFSVCVVLVHLGLISPFIIFNQDAYSEHIFTISDFINFYILFLAVPVFFLISNYLFFLKPEDGAVLFTYIKRIGKIAIFWIVLFNMFNYQGWEIIQCLPKSPQDLIIFSLSGAKTNYWFFITLIGLTAITHFSKRLNVFYVLTLFLITTLLVTMLPVLSVATGNSFLVAHWHPLNFLPYPFAAILVFRIARLERATIKPSYRILFGLIILLVAIADWTFYVNTGFLFAKTYSIPPYSRPSLVLIAMLVLLVAIKSNPKINRFILFMSNNSLSLYCLHPFFLLPAQRFSGGNLFFSLLLVLLFSYLTAIILKRFIQQDLIK